MATLPTPASPDAARGVLLAARDVSKSYGDVHKSVRVLDDVSLDLRAGEFIALLGPSGSGKSTLLRILAGLITPSSGEVLVHDQPLRGANGQVAIVFQGFALYPWLTVQENVEMGLLAKEWSPLERRDRALQAIDLIGLDGFESAYPRELSGGMKQRVGFARALVVEPEVLFLDEPFSALDVLVAENLRHELLDLWQERKMPTRAILMVTHNIDEAVSMADRLLVFGANPGHIRLELPGCTLEHRRDKGSAEHSQLVDTIYRVMTNPNVDAATLVPPTLVPGARPVPGAAAARAYQALPHVNIGQLTGFIERVYHQGGSEDLYELARDLHMEADDLLPLAEAADLLGFGDLQEGDVVLTPEGRQFAEAGVQEEKALFRRQATANIELIRRVVRDIQASPTHRVREDQLLQDLERSFSPAEARQQLDTAIDWGRYAEVFAYDDDAGEFFLEEETLAATPAR
jgi:NitT/TauT family transport system ATP-binding protein